MSDINKLLGIDIMFQKTDITDAQKQLLTERQVARDAKDWQQSDAIRDRLAEQGIAIRDTDDGQIWNRI
jgi:cysteinyl-tRNA synthetase